MTAATNDDQVDCNWSLCCGNNFTKSRPCHGFFNTSFQKIYRSFISASSNQPIDSSGFRIDPIRTKAPSGKSSGTHGSREKLTKSLVDSNFFKTRMLSGFSLVLLLAKA